ncbi:MAG: protein kinase [Anaerolineae bacterium]|nr:protein kinase [Anaerolineae bacterium]
MNNPYVSRGPVRAADMFIGRSRQLTELAAFLRSNQSVSIVGPRKIGKTSLLFHLMRAQVWPSLRLDTDNLFVYLDCSVLNEGGQVEIFGQFAAEIAASLDERNLPPEPTLDKAIDTPTRRSFEGAIRRLNQKGLRVVLVLDEFEQLSRNPELDVHFFNALRAAAGRYQLVFLTASVQPLIDLTFSGRSQEILSSPFFNIFAQLFLGLMLEEEARQLIREPSGQVGIDFPGWTEKFLYDLAGGFPFALQVVCFYACETPRDQAEIERRAVRELNAHFQYYWHTLTKIEQNTLARAPVITTDEANEINLRGILRNLRQRCLLITENETYRYPSQMWAKFVTAQMPATSIDTVNQAPSKSLTHQTSPLGSLKKLGRYEILEEIGRGGFAIVYRARDVKLGRLVALKELHPTLLRHTEWVLRLKREARTIAQLDHPKIVPIYDVVEIEERLVIVMRLVAGPSLEKLITAQGPLSWVQALKIITAIGKGLDYAHEQQILHRDLKPANILMDPEQGPLLSDFGMAKFIGEVSTQVTKDDDIVGTAAYMAPEVWEGEGNSPQSDIYALGCILYEMLIAEQLFQGETPAAVMMAHFKPPKFSRSWPKDAPPGLTEVLQTVVSKAAHKRYPTAQALVEVLVQLDLRKPPGTLAAVEAPALQIQLFGKFRLTYNNDLVATMNSPRLQSLLAYLVLNRDTALPRQHLAFLFWPDSTESQARTNLRKLLYQLRQSLPEVDTFVQSDSQTVQWRAGASFTLDVLELQDYLNQDQYQHPDQALLIKVVDLYTGALLPGCYDDWIYPVRQRFHKAVIGALQQLVALLEAQQAYALGLRYAQRLLELDPLEEGTYQSLMRLHIQNGDRTAAMQAYQACVKILQQEFGAEPNSETQATYKRALQSGYDLRSDSR